MGYAPGVMDNLTHIYALAGWQLLAYMLAMLVVGFVIGRRRR